MKVPDIIKLVYEVEETERGIYYVAGDFIPLQIIVTKRLSEEENLWLKCLTNKLDEDIDARSLIASYLENKENKLYGSVIETIMRANRKRFKEVNGMSDIFMEMVQERFDQKLKEETEKAVEKAVEETVEKEKQKARKAVGEADAKEARKTKFMERINLIRKKCVRNKSLSVIADELETNVDELLPLYDVVIRNMGKSSEEIYELIDTVQ